VRSSSLRSNKRTATRAELGAAGEAIAADFLRSRGLVLLARNYRCRLGEIDLIAGDGDTLVFVEVRLRTSSAFGGAAASVGGAKRARMTRAARHYLATLGREPACRFDALLLDALDPARVEWLRDIEM
jgi:putative endonuclease